MALLILLTTTLFVCITFLSSLPKDTSNPFFAYFLTEIFFIISNFIVFTLGYIISVTIFIKSTKFDKDYGFIKKIRDASINISQVVILSFFLSYTALFFLAFVQLNILSVLININPKIVGVETDKNVISNTLKSNNISPKIVVSNAEQKKELSSIAIAITGNNTFYGKFVLPSISNFFVLPVNNQSSSFLLIDKTLVISKINTDDLQTISPIVGYLFVKEYFANRFIKSYPKVSIMDRSQYQKYREEENNKQILKIDDQLKKVQDFISTISAGIENDNIQISKNKIILNQNAQERNSQYDKCIKYYDLSYCKNLLNQLNKQALSENKDTTDWEKQLEFDKTLLSAYKYFDSFYKTQKDVLRNLKGVIPHELGVFEPNNHIRVALDNTNPHAVADYLETLVHEYFHYSSYVKDKTFSNSFFEESLTEYFARQIIKENLDTSINLGYPIQVKIITQISNRVAESELAEIYFTKDNNLLETTLDRVYGDGFYKKNQNTFEAIQYASTPTQLVKLANDIMQQIGGATLNEKDFYSSSKNL